MYKYFIVLQLDVSGYLKKLTILPVLAAFIAIVAFAPQDAHAASFTAVNGDWITQGLPATLNSGDTVTIPSGVTVTITGTVTNNGGTINVNSGGQITVSTSGSLVNKALSIINNDGTILNNGNINNFGGTINNSPSGKIINKGNINNRGNINNNGGTITNTSHINNPSPGVFLNTNSGLIDNTGGYINNPTTSGVQSEDPCATVTGGTIAPQPVLPLSCKQTTVPEFPIPFGMIIIFAAVAAVYMGIRQKMIPGFKSF